MLILVLLLLLLLLIDTIPLLKWNKGLSICANETIIAKNKQALEQLKNGLHKQCLESLKDAESRLVRRLRDEENDKLVLKLLSITLNNIACYYKK